MGLLFLDVCRAATATGQERLIFSFRNADDFRAWEERSMPALRSSTVFRVIPEVALRSCEVDGSRLTIFVASVFACAVACGGQVTSADDQGPGTSSRTTPTPDDPRSATGAGGGCAGAPRLVYTGHPEAFAVDDAFLYVQSSDPAGMRIERVPPSGGAVSPILMAFNEAPIGFALAKGTLFSAPSIDIPEAPLSRLSLDGDSVGAPVAAARSTPYPGMAIDETNVWSGQTAPGTAIHRWPIAASPTVHTPLPDLTHVVGIAAARDGAYAALLQVSDGGYRSTGFIAKIALDASAPQMLAKDVGEPSTVAIDAQYLYYAAMRGDFTTGALFRMAFDGTDLVKLTEPAPLTFALAEDAIYFHRDRAIYKMSKTGGPITKLGDAQLFAGVQVRGKYVYWSAANDGDPVAAGVYAACR